MPRLYRTREGDVTAVDTKTQLTTLGSESAPGPLLVPANATRLIGILVMTVQNNASTASYAGLVRLEGPGLPEGPEVIAAGAGGTAQATGSGQAVPATMIPLDIPVTGSNEILIFAEMVGADVGQISAGVTLIFEK